MIIIINNIFILLCLYIYIYFFLINIKNKYFFFFFLTSDSTSRKGYVRLFGKSYTKFEGDEKYIYGKCIKLKYIYIYK